MSTTIETAASPLLEADADVSVDVGAGDGWTFALRAGDVLRMVDLEGNQAIDTLFFDAADPSNRYSAVDTIREQGSAYLGLGSRLLALDGDPLV
ncbi:MAG: Urea carboxylase-related aminomethyltransferase, partial [uncultured Solirubrobacteraceae bacterium]